MAERDTSEQTEQTAQAEPQIEQHLARRLNRRRFLTGVAAGAGLAPLAALTTSFGTSKAAPAAQAAALCVGPSQLSPSDFTYLGQIKMPDNQSGTRHGYSHGVLTGRRVGSEVRLFITGASGQASGGDDNKVGDAVYEIRPNAIGAKASLVRNWGDVTKGRQLRRDMNQGYEVRGLLHIDGRLWWAYGSQDFTGQDPDPSIGCSILNDSTGAVTAYGPWRTGEHSQKTRGYLVEVPSDFAFAGGRRIAVGAPPTSGNANGPRGACLTALDAFDPATRAANTASDLGGSKINGKRLIYSDHDHPQARNSNYVLCGFNVANDPSSGSRLYPADPTFNNHGDHDYALDTISSGAWVRTGSVEGIVFAGQITDVVPGRTYPGDGKPHMWYGPADQPCGHGHVPEGEGTGPHSESQVAMFYIWNPAAIAAASNPWGIAPSSAVRMNTLPGASSIDAHASIDRQFGGMWFDAVDRRLYIVDRFGDFSFEPIPAIHVFQVRA